MSTECDYAGCEATFPDMAKVKTDAYGNRYCSDKCLNLQLAYNKKCQDAKKAKDDEKQKWLKKMMNPK